MTPLVAVLFSERWTRRANGRRTHSERGGQATSIGHPARSPAGRLARTGRKANAAPPGAYGRATPPRSVMRRPALAVFLLLAGCASVPDRPAPATPAPAVGGGVAPLAWEAPAWTEDAVLYEAFVPDASPEGTFRGLIQRLPEIEALGATVLWLMPIHPIGVEGRKGDLGSPYAIRDYYAVNPEYGTEDDFRALVDAVHDRGMHLILDFVANHTAPDNAWVAEHPEWYTRGPDGGLSTPISPDGELTDWTDVADLDYSNAALRAEMTDVLRYWVREFDVDGYRCDVAGWVPYEFWAEAIPAVREVKPVLMLAENEDPAIHRVGFDLTYAWPEYAALKAVWGGAPASDLVDLVVGVQAELPPGAGRLRFTTNHDETAWDAPPPALFGGQAGAQAAFVLAASLPGAPLVYNGQELGVEAPVPFFERTPYDWTARPDVRASYARFLEAYERSEALRTGALSSLEAASDDVVFAERTAGDERVVVVVNVRDRPASVTTPPGLVGGAWTDLVGGGAATLGATTTLGPFEARVLRAD